MHLIHGAKTKNDKLDSEKIARLLHSGHLPLSYTYPRALRATRDLLRRGLFFVRRRSELLLHLQISQSQYNLERNPARLDRATHRADIAERFPSGSARLSIAAGCAQLDALDALIDSLEPDLVRAVKVDDLPSLYRLRTIPGTGETIALTIPYEVPDFDRFDTVQQFASY